MLQWLIFVSGRNASPFNLFSESKIWIDAFTAHYLSGRPFHELETFLGKTSRHFQEYLQHPAHHPYWQQLRFSPADYRGFDIPILTLAGQYDDAQRGSLFYLAEHERHSGAKNHYAVIGAWDHGGTRSADQYVGGADFGAPATIDLNQLHLEWYDWVMKGGPPPAFLQDRIAYYVTGSNVWQYANSFTQLGSEKLNLYLASNEQANDVTHSGILQPDLPDSRFAFADNFTFDPRDTRIAELEQTPFTNWLTDQRYDLNLFGNGLVYHTAPFETDVTLGGYVKLKLWIQMDVPDADFQATLAEIAPDGSYLKLTEDLFRARYRDGEDREVFSQPDEINCYELKAFTYFARQIKKGSRLRLVVKCPNSIYLQKNYHSGGNVDNESITDARAAHITLFHDEKHPSLLELPLI